MMPGTIPEDIVSSDKKVTFWHVELPRNCGQYLDVPGGNPHKSRSCASRYPPMLSSSDAILPLRRSWEMATAVKSFVLEQIRNCGGGNSRIRK